MADQPRDTGSRDYYWWFLRQTLEKKRLLEAAGKSPKPRAGYDLDYPMQSTSDDEEQAPSNSNRNQVEEPTGNPPTSSAPTGNATSGNALASNAPAGNAPAGNPPTGNPPTGNPPTGNPPTGNATAGKALASNAPAGNPPAESNISPPSPPVIHKDVQETALHDPHLPRSVVLGSQAALLPVPRLTAPIAIVATDQFAIKQETPVTEAQQLVCWARLFPELWAILLGIYFQESGRHPRQVAGDDQRGHQLLRGRWEVNTRRLDKLAKDGSSAAVWSLPEGPDGEKIARIASWVCAGNQASFEEGIRQWAEELGTLRDFSRLEPILYRSNWTRDPSFSLDWLVMAGIKRMLPGQEKDNLLARAHSESPLFHARCMADINCGLPRPESSGKRKFDAVAEEDKTPAAKRRRYYEIIATNPNAGMQVHGVPLEERAFDSKGHRLPWAYEYLDESRNPRRPPEEKGPFGKSIRRRGSTRSRAATPAKKEDPNVEAFFAAQRYDEARKEKSQQAHVSNSTGSQSGPLVAIDNNIAPGNLTTSIPREPTEVILYGYFPGHQWAAISHYERVSFGMICEDYERQPPQERMRYPSSLSNGAFVHSRPLTLAERKKASRCQVGNCWIKVTFDSAEAAERACYYSPHVIHGAWVYAKPYGSVPPEQDVPILVRNEDRDQGVLGEPRATDRNLRTSGPSPYTNPVDLDYIASNGTATIPRSRSSDFPLRLQPHSEGPVGSYSASTSTTVSSATATGLEETSIQQRGASQSTNAHSTPSSQLTDPSRRPENRPLTAIPSATRAYLRPPSEAFLPQPSWSERLIRRLPLAGWMQADIIGNAVPRLDNGDFDWARASFYWKFWYWLDSHLGTDFCGLRDD